MLYSPRCPLSINFIRLRNDIGQFYSWWVEDYILFEQLFFGRKRISVRDIQFTTNSFLNVLLPASLRHFVAHYLRELPIFSPHLLLHKRLFNLSSIKFIDKILDTTWRHIQTSSGRIEISVFYLRSIYRPRLPITDIFPLSR